mmetsp:Transcript_91241/g.221554  ORF Transcript_91241/g.221554 Transcript_91241/m.221554 type:complete len:235 (+) Transcript_91241:879-1583(+)
MDLDWLWLRLVGGVGTCRSRLCGGDHGRQGLHKLRLELHALEDSLQRLLQFCIISRHLLSHTAQEPHECLDDMRGGYVSKCHLMEETTKDDPCRRQPWALSQRLQNVCNASPSPKAELHIPCKHRGDRTIFGRCRVALQRREEVSGIDRLQQALVHQQNHVSICRHGYTLSTLLSWLEGLARLCGYNCLQGFQDPHCLVGRDCLSKMHKHCFRQAWRRRRKRGRWWDCSPHFTV